MKDQRINTVPGAIILVIIAMTFFSFVWIYAEEQRVRDLAMISQSSVTKQRVLPPAREAEEDLAKEPISRYENGVYTNTKYNFQIKIPEDWTYREFNWEHEPVFAFFQVSSEKQFEKGARISHRSEGTFVLIAPNGISSHGIPGITQISKVKFSEKINKAFDYALIKGAKWATMATFQNPPASWEEYGFVFGRNDVTDKKTICIRSDEEIDLSQCDYFEDDITYDGKIDLNERKQIESILSSFEFIDEYYFFPKIERKRIEEFNRITQKWKKYSDQTYGYEFKYPENYTIEKNKYEKNIDETVIISDDSCLLPFGTKCVVTIRTVSDEDPRIKFQDESSVSKFSMNGYRITYLISDGLAAVIRTQKKVYLMNSLPYPENNISIFEGILSSFIEIQ